MTKVAVIKPDHLGDLVLSSPAIRALQRHFGQVTLLVSGTTLPLARFLFGAIELGVANCPHLAKQEAQILDPDKFAGELNAFDLVLWLRDDPVIRECAHRIAVP